MLLLMLNVGFTQENTFAFLLQSEVCSVDIFSVYECSLVAHAWELEEGAMVAKCIRLFALYCLKCL